MHPTLFVLLLSLLLAAPAVDWGAIGRGAGWLHRFVRRVREPLLASAKWRVECGPVGPDGEIVPHDVREFEENLVVNAGLDAAKDRLFNPATAKLVFKWIAIGTDATAEASGQTGLLAEVARHIANYTAGGIGVCTLDWTFPATVGTGTITEGAVLNDAAVGDMFNRKVWGAVIKGAADALKVSCVITLAPA